MKRFWLHSFALLIGLQSVHQAAAQYPSYSGNTGPSSFPIDSSLNGPPNSFESPRNQSGITNGHVFQGGGPGVSSSQGVPFQPVSHPQAQSGEFSPLPVVPPPTSNSQPGIQANQAYTPQAQAQGTCTDCPSPSNHAVAGHQPSIIEDAAPSVGWESSQHSQHGATGGYFFGQGPLPCGHQHYGQLHPGTGQAVRPYGHQFNGGQFQGRQFPLWQGYSGYSDGSLLGSGIAKPWFFGGGALIFKRSDDFNRILSVDDDYATMLSTGDARNRTMAGFEVMGGRYFNSGRNALAVSYWGLFPETQSMTVFEAGNGLNAAIFRPWDEVDPTSGDFQLNQTGDPATDNDIGMLYNASSAHRIRRNSQFHNIEVNLLGFAVGGAARNFNRPVGGSLFQGHGAHDQSSSRYATGPCCYMAPNCGSRLNIGWLAGFRYLQIRDDLEFAALGAPGLGAETLMYQICTTNHLVGFQIGGRADYCIGSNFNLYGLARSGIYNNHARLCSSLGTDTASAYESGDPDARYVLSRRNDQIAFINEIGAGLGWAFSAKWTATVGYRAILASGVATSVGNIRHPGQTIAQTGINTKDTLLLHGLNIGALYNF